MFSLGNHIGQEIKNLREKLRLTKVELAKLSGISVKAIYQLETGRRKGKIETFVKIRNALKRNFNLDLFEKIGIKIIWKFEDLDQKGLSIIEGGLLGDGCVQKYGVYTQTAKDRRYLEWFGGLLNESGIKYKIIPVRSRTSYSKSKRPFYQLYTHSCPAFFELRKKWYIRSNQGKEIKRIPTDIKLTSIALLHWYLGDGDFKRDRRDKGGGRPCARMSTNAFSLNEIELLIERLKQDLDLNFYPSAMRRNGIKKDRDYVIYLFVNDVCKFFIIIDKRPPREIRNCVTKVIKNRKICRISDKWPNEKDWLRILPKTEKIGGVLQERRKELNFTQRELAEKVGVRKHHISEIENGRKYISLKRFNKFLEALNLDVKMITSRLCV